MSSNIDIIIHRLDEIRETQKDINNKLDYLYENINRIDKSIVVLDSITKWKDNLDEVISIDDLKSIKKWKNEVEPLLNKEEIDHLYNEIDSLKTFKVKAITIWSIIQAIMGFLIFWKKMGE
jgi:hypothetical protein